MSTDTSRRPDMFLERVYPHLSGSHFFTFFCQNSDSLDNRAFRSTQAHSPRNHRFTFTGKEWCKSLWLAQRRFVHGFSETDYSYFGARYYDSDLSGLFLSVDPMSDKYPSLSPYAYCAWNPIKLTDPNGMDTIFSFATRLINDEQNKNNLDILKWLREEGDTPGIVTLGMHGSSQNVAIPSCEGLVEQFFSASDLGRMIKNSNLPDYINNCESNNPTIFLLYCCSTGQGDNSFAEKLSWEISGITIAPQGKLYVNNKGHSIRNSTDKTDIKDQPWNVYYRGRKVLSFDGDLPKEWINKMGGIEKATDIIIEKDAKAHPWE